MIRHLEVSMKSKLTKGTDLVVKDTKATAGALLATAKNR